MGRIAVVGRGRLGHAIVHGLEDARQAVDGPLGRGFVLAGETEVVLLCVPDGEIAAAAATIDRGPHVGHCSGATGLDVLGAHAGFSLHPLMSVIDDAELSASRLRGAAAAIAGSDAATLASARGLATCLGLRPLVVDERDRAAYHAAASVASNFLVTLEGVAERLAATAGVDRQALVPLARASLENWADVGPRRALTGPIARGDDATVARQRAAVSERAPELLGLFDVMCEATRSLARPAVVNR